VAPPGSALLARYKAIFMQNKAGVAQRISDADLIDLFCQTQEEIETYGESNELNLVLASFALELVKRHLFAVESVQFVDLRRPN